MAFVMGQADLHIHSAAGDGLASPRQILEQVERATDLDLIAITDHDDVRGALEARDLAGGYRVEVIVGTEITTRGGHLLAYGVERRYPMFRSLRDSIKEVHDDGGFVVVPHPLSWLTLSAGERALRRLIALGDPRERPDAIELLNPSFAGRVAHRRAIALNERTLKLPQTGGSDAHHLERIGTARTLYPGRGSADFVAALREHRTTPTGAFWTLRDHLAGAAEQQLRAMVLSPAHKVLRNLPARRRQ